jgi:ferredoxin-NADP reductase
VTLSRADGLARAYSIASQPDAADGCVELHVRVLSSGRMSSWLGGGQAVGERVSLRGPIGECFYLPGNPQQPLLLAGTGTGLAPLWGIVLPGSAALARLEERAVEALDTACSVASVPILEASALVSEGDDADPEHVATLLRALLEKALGG